MSKNKLFYKSIVLNIDLNDFIYKYDNVFDIFKYLEKMEVLF